MWCIWLGMNNCKKCNHTCHCGLSAGCQCDCVSCDCEKSQAQDLSYENNGVVVDSTQDCEGCE